MKRIRVIGRTGSGKSTFSSELSSLMNIPHIEMDKLFWKPAWQQSSEEEFIPKVQKALDSGIQWIQLRMKSRSVQDIEKIGNGLDLEDGHAMVDKVSYVQNKPANEIGIEIHIGRNRIVRRIFQHLGYEVVKLDRVYYAGLTKKDIPRGMYRFLKEEEVRMLKYFV